MQLSYDKEVENLRRQLTAAMKTINSMVERYEKELKEFDLNKKKVTQLELRFLTDSQKIASLEAKCEKYKKTTDALKEKAINVLQMSQKCVNTAMERRDLSPQSHIQTTKNKTQSSFNLSRTETEKLINSTNSKAPIELPLSSSSRKHRLESTQEKLKNTCESILKTGGPKLHHSLGTPMESEQVEFNVYDYTRHKEVSNNAQEINNTRDTAEFGDGDMKIDQGIRNLKEAKVAPLQIENQQEVPEKQPVPGKYFRN